MDSVPVVSTISPSAATDRRRNIRYRLAVPISIHADNGPVIPAITLEIGKGGFSAVLAVLVNVGDMVQIQGIIPGMITAQACRQIGRVYGFKFLEPTSEQVRQIQKECQGLPLYPPNHTGI